MLDGKNNKLSLRWELNSGKKNRIVLPSNMAAVSSGCKPRKIFCCHYKVKIALYMYLESNAGFSFHTGGRTFRPVVYHFTSGFFDLLAFFPFFFLFSFWN